MTLTALYLLPALAVAIVLQGSWIKGKANFQYRSRKFRRRVQARAIFLRFLVAALLLATVITTFAPALTLSPLAQGTLITAILMLPVVLYLLYQELSAMLFGKHARNTDAAPANGTQSSADAVTIGNPGVSNGQSDPEAVDKVSSDSVVTVTGTTATATSADEVLTPKGSPETVAPESEQLQSTVPSLQKHQPKAQTPAGLPARKPVHGSTAAPGQDTAAKHPGRPVADSAPADKVHRVASLHSHAYSAESILDQTFSMDEQMESLDELVEYHDIGADELDVNAGGDSLPVEDQNPLEKAIAIARDAMLEDQALVANTREQLPAKSRQQLMEMVVRLQSDKMKLQKLVIAQKSVIESEKQSHARTRIVVKDAISVMRHARHGQRVAEKIARRERTLRQTLESDNTKLRRALDNALSTLNDKKKEAEH